MSVVLAVPSIVAGLIVISLAVCALCIGVAIAAGNLIKRWEDEE
jgi:ABC-type phosphate transport system permease subunit